MQDLFEEIGSEQRFIDCASPLRARKNPLVRSRGSSQVRHENLCPPGDHKLLIFQPKFRKATSVARHNTIQSQLLRRQKMTEVLFACFEQSSLRSENLTL
jgi:hypothetical protein